MIHQTEISSALQALLEFIFYLNQNYQSQLHELRTQVDDLTQEMQLKSRTIQRLEDEVAALQCLQHPYSLDGDAICNWD